MLEIQHEPLVRHAVEDGAQLLRGPPGSLRDPLDSRGPDRQPGADLRLLRRVEPFEDLLERVGGRRTDGETVEPFLEPAVDVLSVAKVSHPESIPDVPLNAA
jgi:hypothetical protein